MYQKARDLLHQQHAVRSQCPSAMYVGITQQQRCHPLACQSDFIRGLHQRGTAQRSAKAVTQASGMTQGFCLDARFEFRIAHGQADEQWIANWQQRRVAVAMAQTHVTSEHRLELPESRDAGGQVEAVKPGARGV